MRGRKLTIKYGITGKSAEALVEAGYGTPAKIRAAKDKDLKAVISASQVKKLRGK